MPRMGWDTLLAALLLTATVVALGNMAVSGPSSASIPGNPGVPCSETILTAPAMVVAEFALDSGEPVLSLKEPGFKSRTLGKQGIFAELVGSSQAREVCSSRRMFRWNWISSYLLPHSEFCSLLSRFRI